MSTVPSSDVRDLLALQLTPGLGPQRIAALLAHFGSAGEVRRARAHQLSEVPGIGMGLAQQLVEGQPAVDVDGEIERLTRAGVRLEVLGQPGYPAALAAIDGAPHLLYVRGTLVPGDEPAVALVGSRRCSDHGVRAATRLATGLARAGITVVSGLAYGIDAAAHRATLQAGGRTLAVLAGGLGKIYPREHKGLALEVAANGALLTESSMNQDPLAGLFPARNRIISGLCQAVVIVEAAEKSGALITADHAAEQGRTVLAVPGPFESASSGGCHALLRQGAVLCRSVDDILEEVRGLAGPVAEMRAAREKEASRTEPAPSARPAVSGPPSGLDETQRRTWEFLRDGPRAVDEVARHLNLGMAQLSGVLLTLEMKKVVRRLPGNRYERF
jgi:DNA processing protein